MNTDKLINILKMGSLNIPMYLIKYYQVLEIDLNALIILSYLLNNNHFDCKKISLDLNLDEKIVLNSINMLQEKGLLSICVKKDDKGIVNEYLSLEPLFNKLSLILIDSKNNEKNTTNIYEVFEKELGRTLSPMEYEIITGWLDSKYNEEVIMEALKEAVFNGANNLRYIDKILYEWHKKGIKKVSDIEKDREKFRKDKDKKIEVPDYNWLEDNEE